MGEYKHTISKTGLQGVAQNPPQNTSNGNGLGLDQPLTIQNAAMIGIAAATGKKLVSNFGGAIIDQLGNSRIDEFTNVANAGLGYLTIGLATGFNPYILAAKAVVDVSSYGIDSYINKQATDWENERIAKTRGVQRTMVGEYYG